MRRQRARAFFPVVLAAGALAAVLGATVLAHGGVIPPLPAFKGVDGSYSGPLPPGPSTPAPAPTAAPQPQVAGNGAGTGGATKPTTGLGLAGRALGPSTGGDASQGADSWETWWFFNRDAFLDLRRAVATVLATRGADDTHPSQTTSALPSPEVVRSRVVPALKHLLDTDRANDPTTSSLMALGRIGEPADLPKESSAVPRMLHALSDANQEIAETAALALGILRSSDSTQPLVDLVTGLEAGRALVGAREVRVRTRAFAAYGLGLAATRMPTNRERQRIARALTDVLADARGPVDVQCAALLALSLDRLDAEAVESTSAAWISRQTLVRYLMRFARDPARSHLARAHAVTATARLATDAPDGLRLEVVDLAVLLAQRETRSETEVVLSAIQALGKLAGTGNEPADRKARATVIRELDAPEPQVRGFASIALAEIAGRAADDDAAGAVECRGALANEALRGKSSSRPWAIVALGVLERRRADLGRKPNETARQVLREWLVSARSRNEVGAGALALGLARETRAEALLRSKLADTNEDTGQGYLALALGMIGSREAAPALRGIVQASRYRPQLLEHAAVALALLGDKECTTAITDLLREAKSLAEQAALARSLGLIGDARTVEPLLAMIAREDLTASTRGFAAVAVGGVADPSPLPWRTPIVEGINYCAVVPSLASGDGTGIFEIL